MRQGHCCPGSKRKKWDPAVLSPTSLGQMPSNTLFALQWLVDRHVIESDVTTDDD